jgi:tetratricopeptide (TPR) repeat protein
LESSQRDLNEASASWKKGVAFERLKCQEEALAAFEQVIQLHPDEAGNHYEKSQQLCELKRYQEALATYQRVAELEPKNCAIHQAMSQVHALPAQEATNKAKDLRKE